MIRNVVLSILLVGQLAVWFLVAPPWKTSAPKSEAAKPPTFPSVDLGQIGGIRIVDPTGATLELSLRDGVWVLESLHGYPAIQKKVEEVLDELKLLPKSEFRTDKRFLHEDLQVDDLRGQKVTLLTAKRAPLLDLVIGKQDIQGSRGAFIRVNGTDEVWVCPSQKLATLFSTVVKDWYDPAIMDVSFKDPQRMTTLRNACFHIEVEMNRPKRDDKGQPVSPPQMERLRYVYERVEPEGEDGGDPWWKVVEPEGKEDLRLDDLLVKGIVTTMLNLRATEIVGSGLRPEYGLSDRDELAVRVEARFREESGETIRVLEIGGEHEVEPVNGVKRPPDRFARAKFPGGGVKESFVFTIPQATVGFLQRDPETFQKPMQPQLPRQKR